MALEPVRSAGSGAAVTGRLIRVCAWCKKVMGTKPCLPEMDGQETHGICRGCAAKLGFGK